MADDKVGTRPPSPRQLSQLSIQNGASSHAGSIKQEDEGGADEVRGVFVCDHNS